MAKFTLEIECEGAAYEDWPEEFLRAALHQAIEHITEGRLSYTLHDVNGNRIGGHLLDDIKNAS